MVGRKHLLLTVALGITSGFAGGAIFTRAPGVGAVTSETIRAARFEVVNQSGKTLAFWGLDTHGNTVIDFVGESGKDLATFGLGSDGKPFLVYRGVDGKTRADLRLGWHEKPSLELGDEKWEGRVGLGFIAGDAPSPEDETWGVAFGAPMAHRTLAAIGFSRRPSDGMLSGSIVLKGSDGRVWRAP